MERPTKKEIETRLRNKIKEAKKDYGLPATKIAKDLNISVITIYNFVAGNQSLSINTIIEINNFIDQWKDNFNKLCIGL